VTQAQSYTREESVVKQDSKGRQDAAWDARERDRKYVGLDVHKATIAVAIADEGRGEVRSYGTIKNTPEAVAKLIKKLGPAERLACCYEAGPCGYGLQRQLVGLGASCIVVAPSLIPTRPGDRVKTDRRDAVKLARLLRSGELTSVWVPDAEHEALRDLSRAREAARDARHRARQQLGKLLPRLGIEEPSGTTRWSQRYRQWLGEVKLEQPWQQVVLADAIETVDAGTARLKRLEVQLKKAATVGRHAPLIAALQSLRGVGVITAVTLVAELGDLGRFPTARPLMAYLGLVPSEHSSGGSQRRGRITRAGNSHVRHVLVQAAWHYRHPPKLTKALEKRQAGQPTAVTDVAWRAQERLHARYRKLAGRKGRQKAVIAVARELAGFVWALARAHADPLGADAAQAPATTEIAA
jgi:transposase